MGVDWYSCNNCRSSFPDCGDYVFCGCGKRWCSDECANSEGYSVCECKLGKDVDDAEGFCEEGCEMYADEYDSCSSVNCKHFVCGGCDYCNGRNYDDDDLLEKALQLLGITREELIKKM